MLVGVGTLPVVTIGENQALAGPNMFNTIWGSLGNRFGAYSYLFLNFEMAQTLSQIYIRKFSWRGVPPNIVQRG